MIRLLVGVLLLPFSACLSWAAAKALGGVAMGAPAAAPFTAGLALTAVVWMLARQAKAVRWMYVLGHEMTHALTAWALGGKVYEIRVGEQGGHVDLSESSALVALAPYCVPFHAVFVIVGYRLLLWLRPDAQVEGLFLLLMGGALAFHALMTWETLTQVRQPDLKAAGGIVFSLAWIGAANGLMVLLLLKALFPETVALGSSAKAAAVSAWSVWTSAWALARGLWR